MKFEPLAFHSFVRLFVRACVGAPDGQRACMSERPNARACERASVRLIILFVVLPRVDVSSKLIIFERCKGTNKRTNERTNKQTNERTEKVRVRLFLKVSNYWITPIFK